MRRTTALAMTAPALGLVAALTLAPPASAGSATTHASLRPVNDHNASGQAFVDVKGNKITVTMAAHGLVPNQPHAAHIHFAAAARHECPSIKDDTSGDGTINTTEGGPAYGDIVVSLTKTGDTSPKSGLAVDRFSTAPGGTISYERGSITVSDGVAEAISKGQSVVVIHGVDHNHDGKYSGDTKSDLDPTLPTEATDPALCGALHTAPAGGMDTGGGMTSTTNDNGMLLAVGGVALAAAAGSGAVAARRARARG